MLDSVRRRQPLMGTLFPVDAADAAADGMAVRLPPWLGRGDRQQQGPDRSERAANQRQAEFASVATRGRVTANGRAKRRSPERKWAAPTSAPRPGFPVQRSPAVSPQKPSAASATTRGAHQEPSATTLDAEADRSGAPASEPPGMASGATRMHCTDSDEQDVNLHPQLTATPATGAAAVEKVVLVGGEASSATESSSPDAALVGGIDSTANTAPAQPADSPPPHVLSTSEEAQVSAEDVSAAREPAQPADPAQQPERAPSTAGPQPTEGHVLQADRQASAGTQSVTAAPARTWDGNDAALLAVIVEHAKVLRTINAGEAGSSCSLM